MRPTHISIVGKSKHMFNREIQPELRDGQMSGLVASLAPGPSILFTKHVKSADDLKPLVDFLVRRGIPRTDIRIRFPSERPAAVLKRSMGPVLAESPLSFGADVAERDVNLARYFVTTSTFVAVADREKHIIVGPKGSGKSAILRELTTDDPNALVITPEHYATDVLETLRKATSGPELSAYTTTWKYTLLVELFRRLVEKRSGNDRAVAQLRKYLADHGHLGNSLSLSERFMSYLRRITQIKGKVGPVEGTLAVEAADEMNRFFKMDEVLGLIPALQQLLRKAEFTVYLDELDQSWTNSQTANNFLLSLLTAAIQLQSISDGLHVVVFLRSEIFELLKPHLPQLDKLRSEIAVIQWSHRELSNLIASRALDSLGVEEDVAAETAIRLLFPGTLVDGQVHTFDYLLSRTSLRPREVIQFANLALDIARQERFEAITLEAVERAEEQFSSWKHEYIVAENMFIHPQLGELTEELRGLPRVIGRAELDSHLTDVLLRIPESSEVPGWYRPTMEPIDVLRILYQLEIIGIERSSSRSLDDARIWEAYDFVFARPKGKPELSQSFLFHPGLWKSLELA